MSKTVSQDGDGLVPKWSATLGISDTSVQEYDGYGHNTIVKYETDDIITYLKG